MQRLTAVAFGVLVAVLSGCGPAGPAPTAQQEAVPTATPVTAIDFEGGTVSPAEAVPSAAGATDEVPATADATPPAGGE